LDSKELQILAFPPYSPDLAPCDFYLFPKIKDILRGKRFDDEEEAVKAFEEEIRKLKSKDWQGCFDVWFGRMRSCVDLKGEYFEK